MFILVRPASAHANLISSDPQNGAVLPQAPNIIVLQFSEDLDPSFSAVELLDSNGNTVVSGPGTITSGKPRQITLNLPPIPNGVYSAAWKARSATDGHVTEGAVSFAVGAGGSLPSLLPPPGTPDPATAMPPIYDVLVRWLNFLAAALGVGSIFFGLFVWKPAIQPIEEADWLDRDGTRLLKRISLGGIAALALATVATLFVQASLAGGSDYQHAILEVAAGRTGQLLGARLAVLILMAPLVWRLTPPGSKPAWLWLASAGLGCAALATFSLQSHAAATGSLLPVAADLLHLMAMAAWVGGLLPLALLVLGRGLGEAVVLTSQALSRLVSAFTRVALPCVVILGITGVYSATLHIDTVPGLTDTSYGRSLDVKVGLFVLLVGLGAVNLLLLSPRIRKASARAVTWLGRTVRVEIVLGMLIVVAAGLLTGLAPAKDALQAQRQLYIQQTARVDQVRMVLKVAPGKVGDNELGLDLSDGREGAASASTTVLMRFQALDMAMGVSQVEAQPAGGSRYTARGSYFSMGGHWQVEVIVRKPGFDDVTHNFSLLIAGYDAEAASQMNPVPPLPASIAAGKALYTANCVPCHGVSGKGNGPLAPTLNPHPADLTYHAKIGVHSDFQLFDWISNGFPGSAMPAFKTALTDQDRWNLVNYLRSFANP